MLPQISPASSFPDRSTRFHLQSSIDLSDLDEDQLLSLRVSVTEFRSAGKRLMGELFVMTLQLTNMQSILGSRFIDFAVAEFGLSSRTIYRYLHLHTVLRAHFSIGENINALEASKFTQRALNLLSPDTEDVIISELKAMADSGHKIDEKLVRQVIEQHDESKAVELAGAKAELSMATRELETIRQQREADQGRAARDLANHAELLRRSEQNRADLEAEIESFKKQETVVATQTVTVDIVPPGFATLEEAIAAKESQLNRLKAEEAAQKQVIADLATTKKKVEDSLNDLNAGADEFLALKEQLEALMVKFPIAMMKAMSSTDKTIKSAIQGLGQTMVCFGNQLTTATASAK